MKQLAIHLHLYYMEQLPQILKSLNNIDLAGVNYDLFVTLPETSFVPPELLVKYPQAKIITVANKGYDVGAFIKALHSMKLDNYDYVLKLHTKSRSLVEYARFNNRRISDALWSKMLWESLTGSPDIVLKNLQILATEPNVGMIGSSFCITKEQRLFKKMEHKITAELQKLGLPKPRQQSFVAGTMFIAKTAVLKPFLAYTLKDFPTTNKTTSDNTLAHVLERLFGVGVSSLGFELRGVCYKNYLIERFIPKVMRFLVQKKHTHNGTMQIKFCRIPVYQKRYADI